MKKQTPETPAPPKTATHFIAGFAIGGLFVSALWKQLWWLELLCLAAFVGYILFNSGFTRRFQRNTKSR
jgi:uncharacterized membrane protein YbjE (DUF340 family)